MQSHLPLVSILPTALYWLLSLPKTWPCLGSSYLPTGGSLVAQLETNPPVMQETPVRFLGWEDPLEKGKATHSSILAWRIPWTEEPGGLQSTGVKESDTTEQLSL